MLKLLARSAAFWTAVGLSSGVAYRELMKGRPVSNTVNHMALIHTHTLALGMLFFLLVLALTHQFGMHTSKRMTWFVWLWNVGLGISVTHLAVKGWGERDNAAWAQSQGLSHFAGLGHGLLTVGAVVFFLALLDAVNDHARQLPAAPPKPAAKP